MSKRNILSSNINAAVTSQAREQVTGYELLAQDLLRQSMMMEYNNTLHRDLFQIIFLIIIIMIMIMTPGKYKI
jgi:hypothetical protein